MSEAAALTSTVPSLRREAGIAGVAVGVTALVASGWALGFQVSNLHNGLLAISFTGVGLYVLRARPGHAVARLFVAAGVQSALMFAGRQYGLAGQRLPGADWAAWSSIWQVPLGMGITGLVFLTFPTGRLPTPRWRPAARAFVGLCVLLAVASALWPIEDDWRRPELTFPFDVGHRHTAVAVLTPLMSVLYQGFLLFWVVAVVARYRRASGDEVRQLRWFVASVMAMAAVLIGGLAAFGTPVPGLVATALIPVAAGVAILKYRLYEIDPVINKSIVIGAMVLLVTAGYIAIVVGLGSLVPASDGLLTLLTTAVVAVAFEPMRRRAQQLADRLVYGHRATPYEALAQLSTRLQHEPEGLLDGLAAAVASGVGAREVVLWAGTEEALRPVGHWPEHAAPGPHPRPYAGLDGIVRPIRHHGGFRGALTATKPLGESLTAAEDRLLGDLAAQAGLVLAHEERAGELQAAARRIVTAGDAARRRIERDLHDGAQQRLVTLGLELGAAVDAAPDADQAQRLGRLREQLLEATAELRELAQGLHPSLLTQAGLAVALGTLADRSPVPVRVEADLEGRLPAEVEATAYFLVSEALTNAARHAGHTLATVRVAQVDGGLFVEVTDDGRGGADPVRGTGLRGLQDRLTALGGDLHVTSAPGTGTTLSTVLPCG